MNTGMNDYDLQELAYRIWEAEGRPVGQAERHWQMALEQAQIQNELSTTGSSTSGQSFLGEDMTSDQHLLQDERQYALQNNPLDETAQTTMEATGANTAQQPLVSSQPSEKIGGKRKTKTKAKSADTLADQDTGSKTETATSKGGKTGKRKSSNNIFV